MSHGPSTLGSITTSSLSPTAPTISTRSSSAHGLLSALIRVHRPVAAKSPASIGCAVAGRREGCDKPPPSPSAPEPAMSDLVGLFTLLAPFFGLIGLGFFCGKVADQPEGGLA